jgi:orotate phosphoribosyltransferase
MKKTTDQLLVSDFLGGVNAFVEGHFVYKSGLHGNMYIDKERLGRLGGRKMTGVLHAVARNAYAEKMMQFKMESTVTIIGPAFGAINYALPICSFLEEAYKTLRVNFRPGRTQLREDGKTHYFPEKLLDIYGESDELIVIEDIVNMGSTIREINALTKKTFGKPVSRALCIVNRGGQTAQSMGIEEFHPLLDVCMEQHDPRTSAGLVRINQLGEINLTLGKGGGWVKMFGQPQYHENTDFSAYEFTVPVAG